ncbi:MAG: imidazole glycerol phosphate synthase subunit HisF [Dehalococcoidia bacterium]|nr:imidazole glycerol phosphate synthase subunit HisF [Dehalococcoidia bacterium]MDP7612804.1 imidazole glycerol phosphate synthase subunit HisF [Dehalococcoidia bacterium]
MLTKRIIPCLDVDGGRVVKGVNFIDIIDAGDPSELAKFYNSEGADELVFLDITASSDRRETMVNVVEKVSAEVFIPLTVGGGIRSVEDMGNMLDAGADKVSINSAAVNNPKLIEDCSKRFGSQCVVVAIDAKRYNSTWIVYTHGGRKKTQYNAVEWANRACGLGAGELLVTSIDQDGKQDGYDNELLCRISSNVKIPLIASGGAGKLNHFLSAFNEGQADAVLAASLFHFGKITIKDLKVYLQQNDINIRI